MHVHFNMNWSYGFVLIWTYVTIFQVQVTICLYFQYVSIPLTYWGLVTPLEAKIAQVQVMRCCLLTKPQFS